MAETRLYHCTKFEYLKGILESKAFKPSYCLEPIWYFDDKINLAFSMVCFADLMEAELKEHMNKFHSDCYLQMSKEWARKNGLSNVLYYETKTNSAFAFREIVNYAVERLRNSRKAELDKFTIGASLLMALTKPYKGYYWDKNKQDWSSEETQFFNEREWRFIPITKKHEHFYLEEEEYKNEATRNRYLDELTNNSENRLHFSWDDIKVIGIGIKEYENEISQILRNHYNLDISDIKKKLKVIE